MKAQAFLRALTGGGIDVIGTLLEVLHETEAPYCVIGGLAVNAYVEPVVSLDLDVVVATGHLERVVTAARVRGMRVRHFPRSVNLTAPASDLRVQFQTDPRYQEFLTGAREEMVLGYPLRVAALEDLVRGKVWACTDPERRGSKRRKDVADLARLVEAFPRLAAGLPREVRRQVIDEADDPAPTGGAT